MNNLTEQEKEVIMKLLYTASETGALTFREEDIAKALYDKLEQDK